MKKYSVLIMMLSLCIGAAAESFVNNGIKYVTKTNNEVGVTANSYSGSVTIPATVSYNGINYSVTSIESSAFNNCSNLTSVYIGSNVTTIESGAFGNCKSLTYVSIPNSVKSIKGQAFSGCKSLTSISLPSSLTTLSGQAFLDCTGLKSITLPSSLTQIAFGTFSGCTGLTSVTIPSSITSIANNAFYGCKSLTSVTIPTSITSIDQYAFFECTSLTTVYYLATNPVGINSQAFSSNVYSNATLMVAYGKINSVRNLSGWSSFYNRKEYEEPVNIGDEFVVDGIKYRVVSSTAVSVIANSYSGSVTIPSRVTYRNHSFSVAYIGNNAFGDCENLTSVIIPNSVEKIGQHAFGFCYALESVVIPNSVRWIGDYAFCACISLTSVVIPSSVSFIGDHAFSRIHPQSIVVDKDNKVYDSRDNCNAIIDSKTNTLIFGCENTTIPTSVPNIGECAFEVCIGLTSLKIPDWVTFIDDCAFTNCRNITSLVIPSSVSFIGEGAFFACESLQSIEIDKNNSVYDSRDNCNAIVESNTNTLIFGCKNTVIPSSVTKIGWAAFDDCPGLTSITIPNPVTSIGEYAFSRCPGLREVKFLTYKPFSVNDNCFSESTYRNVTLIVRNGYRDKIKDYGGWKNFKNIVEQDLLRGDANDDGKVNTADVVAVYSYIEKGEDSGFSRDAVNVNGNSAVNTADVVAIYDIIINGD